MKVLDYGAERKWQGSAMKTAIASGPSRAAAGS